MAACTLALAIVGADVQKAYEEAGANLPPPRGRKPNPGNLRPTRETGTTTNPGNAGLNPGNPEVRTQETPTSVPRKRDGPTKETR